MARLEAGLVLEMEELPEVLTLEEEMKDDPSEDWWLEVPSVLVLERMVEDSSKRLGLEERVGEVVREVEGKVDRLEEEMAITDDMFLELEKRMDRLRRELYAEVGERGEEPELQLVSDLAEQEPAELEVGSRCLLRDRGTLRLGVVAEPPKTINGGRYLVFLDCGSSLYCRAGVLEPTEQEGAVRPWVTGYLEQYPERAMVRLVQGQQVELECEGALESSVVEEVDCSLALLRRGERREWVYRGDPRLGPLQPKTRTGRGRATRVQGPPRPVVEYRKFVEAEAAVKTCVEAKPASDTGSEVSVGRRPVARKSTARSSKAREEVREVQGTEGEVTSVEWSPPPLRPFSPHVCCSACTPPYSEETTRGSPLLQIPLLHGGWARSRTRHSQGGRRGVVYLAPCGRRLRSLEEVHSYLLLTKQGLSMDMFTFDWWVQVLGVFQVTRDPLCAVKDISYGKEGVAVSCVNLLDRAFPEYIEYSTSRLPQSKVPLDLDPGFLPGCSCQDDCRDSSSCSCHGLTTEAARALGGEAGGYAWRRLHEPVIAGVYECNVNCGCSRTCLNRVAQQPLRNRLQVFKTISRGWGLRTMTDLPGGAFVCTYVGNLYEAEEANTQGQNFGDEYFAELDLVENVERHKEGYEAEVVWPKDWQKEDSVESNTSSNDVSGKCDTDETESESSKRRSSRLAHVTKKTQKKPKARKPKKQPRISFRKLFGPTEEAYIMDAKTIGNLGRYMNHSCQPNVLVQNVFVDSHDLRFPWVAFFTTTYVRAGEELVWDYNYEVGSVEGKRIDCCCGAGDCRGRLL